MIEGGAPVKAKLPPGEPSRITLYRDGDVLAFVELDPATAIGTAGDLIEAARIRLGRHR